MKLTLAIGLSFAAEVLAITGKTYTGWDCCKPGCSWRHAISNQTVDGVPKVCNAAGTTVANPFDIETGCAERGGGQQGGFMCSDYSPTPVDEYLSYGYATMVGGNSNCCKCYQMTWTSGEATGKSMVVQVINSGSPSGDVQNNDIIVLVPGGGAGPNSGGCRTQYGTNSTVWGQDYGGLRNAEGCANLPASLQGGCYWRFNWARGSVNSWNINYQEVQCPARLSQQSGCMVRYRD